MVYKPVYIWIDRKYEFKARFLAYDNVLAKKYFQSYLLCLMDAIRKHSKISRHFTSDFINVVAHEDNSSTSIESKEILQRIDCIG